MATSLGGQYPNQIDATVLQSRVEKPGTSAKIRPGWDCGSDHELAAGKEIQVQLKRKKGINEAIIQLESNLYD